MSYSNTASSKSIATPGSRKYSISEAFSQSFSNSPNPFDFGGRSYVFSGSVNNLNSPAVQSGHQVHEQTAHLANIGVTDDDDSNTNDDYYHEDSSLSGDNISSSPPIPIRGAEAALQRKASPPPNFASSTTPLISTTPYKTYMDEQAAVKASSEPWNQNAQPQFHNPFDMESSPVTDVDGPFGTANGPGAEPSFIHRCVVKPVQYLPAVFLGTLLNILDGLSYGMIMFPISEAIFSHLAPSGLSMFYMSTIVSQLVFSLGGSAFKSGIGSEMIEVTPFFHSMAFSIMNDMGGSDGNSDAIIATTIVTYAISSIVTGIVFFILGKLKLGSLVGFFPRHILVGCIGGVGYFLVVTGIEVSSRLEGGLLYDWPTFEFLFLEKLPLLQWTTPLILALILIALQHRIHNSLLVPLFFIGVFVAFHAIVAIVPQWSLEDARDFGWVFPAVEDNEPWYGFYSLYKFQLVDWWCIMKQIPSMLALTFFGILHVPINVPALAVSVGMDQFDVDRELVAHGYSNALSGMIGSIQNYLVYTNSVLFVRAGADDRLAGILLAVATGAVMMAGPVVIGYIPVCVVGSLIYLLGYELLKESLYDTWGRLKNIEYSTIIIIVLVMGAWDFVYGVLVGILLACLSFVVDAARRPVISGIYTGVVARSTVLRHPKQQDFLKDVGDQICVVKLQGPVFFGSIGGAETDIRARFDEKKFNETPIKFLILDMKGVVSIDFSAAEGFRRILNLANEKDTQLIISSVNDNDSIVKALRDAGLWDNDHKLSIELFNTLNYALEWCENSFLSTYKNVKKQERSTPKAIEGGAGGLQVPSSPNSNHNHRMRSGSNPNQSKLSIISQTLDGTFGTPRTTQVLQAATRTVKDEQRIQNRYYTSSSDSSFKKQPLPLIMITFSGLSTKSESFWTDLTSYFTKEEVPEGVTFYDTDSDKPTFFLVESGLIRSVVKFEDGDRELHSSILPLTAFGDLSDMGGNYSQIIYSTVNDSVVWKLNEEKLANLAKKPEGAAILNELLTIQTKLVKERFDTMTANLVISA
ncbi:hypothetical protein CAAN3_19S01816 [[Candida] anglica]